MLTVRIIPCLDMHAGRVVKGVRFQNLRDSGDPVELAMNYEAQGADELVLLDVSATTEGRGNSLQTVRNVREVLSIPLTVGGGVRTLGDAECLLEAGADKVSVNTAAVDRPELIETLSARFGRQCVVLAIDAKEVSNGSYEVLVRSGKIATGINAVEWAKEGTTRGAGEILLTSFDRDGTRKGYDLGMLSAVSDNIRVPLIASGGASCPEHFLHALTAGADAVLAASIFHEGEYTVGQVKEFLRNEGIEVRK